MAPSAKPWAHRAQNAGPHAASSRTVLPVAIRDWFRPKGVELALASEALASGQRFNVDIDTGVLYGVPSIDDVIYGRGRISRREALAVPAVKRARDLICGEIGQFPLVLVDPAGKPTDWSLLNQPEAGIARSVSIARLVEDMLLYERGWWKATHVGWHGKPAQVARLDPESVAIHPTTVTYPGAGTATVWPEVPGVIRFDSPNGGLLDASPAVRACIALARARVRNVVDGTPPTDYFTPKADVSYEPEEEDVIGFLDDWSTARKRRATGYVPGWAEYKTGGFNPEQLQMDKANDAAVLDVARLTGIDAEELSVAVTSRTYANMQDRRRHRVESVLGPFMTAIALRLSMEDVTPRGFKVQFDPTKFLALDDQAAATTDEVLIRSKVITPEEARARRGLPPRSKAAAEETADTATAEETTANA